MTATAITYLVAQEHINDLMRGAEHRRLAAEARAPRRVRLSVARVIARRAPRTATA